MIFFTSMESKICTYFKRLIKARIHNIYLKHRYGMSYFTIISQLWLRVKLHLNCAALAWKSFHMLQICKTLQIYKIFVQFSTLIVIVQSHFSFTKVTFDNAYRHLVCHKSVEDWGRGRNVAPGIQSLGMENENRATHPMEHSTVPHDKKLLC